MLFINKRIDITVCTLKFYDAILKIFRQLPIPAYIEYMTYDHLGTF